jgi:hypothetical protein
MRRALTKATVALALVACALAASVAFVLPASVVAASRAFTLRQGEHAIALWASHADNSPLLAWHQTPGTRCIRERGNGNPVVGCSITFYSDFGNCTIMVAAWLGHSRRHHYVPAEQRYRAQRFGQITVEPLEEECGNGREAEPYE